MKKTETPIVRDIQEYLNSRRIYHIRVNADGTTVGVPDIIACYLGKFVGLECKTATGKPNGAQPIHEVETKRCNGEFYYVRSVEDVKAAFEDMDYRLLGVDAQGNDVWNRKT